MSNSIMFVLSLYGFEARRDGSMFWGIGSLMWGETATVKAMGRDFYEVKIHHWAYDCDGDPVVEKETREVLHGARALERVFTEMTTRYFWKGYR